MTGTKRKYIIVGAEVDQPEAWLHKDGSISPRKGSDGEPLNVEYIGRLMVELSQRGKAGVPKAELDALEERVKRALRAVWCRISRCMTAARHSATPNARRS
ncbi:hypothetical protein LOS78_14100 [Paracoccus sp. MA]|uniref:hypothetical protein n=1 Tax=Paracoccus sp. MA TaxID=2895796 RepID=UPI001E3AD4C5|nr:hypothetical protein [Paracoccus sp. MA]UFM64805.1 hypothetical protein LOS78_14100 [Paracoccus sp. MA]